MALKATFECSHCGRQLREGERIVVIGKTPLTGLSAPQGRADVILEKIGDICCEDCFRKRYERKKTR
jgi:hypothetical protein